MLTSVHIVVVTWNQAALLERCVSSISAAAHESNIKVAVAIVDNASGPESYARISKLSIPAHWALIFLDHNIGYAAALNAGCRALAGEPSDYTVLLNDDCILPQNFFSALDAHILGANQPAVIGFPVRDSIGERQRVLFGMRYWPQIGLAVPVLQPEKATSKQGLGQPLVYPCGAAIACRTDFLTAIGGVPATNFLYFEELQLIKSAAARREATTLCRSLQITHIGGASTSHLPRIMSAHYFATLAALRFTLAHYPVWLPTVFLARALGTLQRMAKEGSITPSQSFVAAIREFLRRPRAQSGQTNNA